MDNKMTLKKKLEQLEKVLEKMGIEIGSSINGQLYFEVDGSTYYIFSKETEEVGTSIPRLFSDQIFVEEEQIK